MTRSALCVIAAALLASMVAPTPRAERPAATRSGAAEASRTAPGKQTAKDVQRRFEERYRHAATLKAIFYERYSDGKGAGEAESGTVYFSRPGRMRWEYESPEKKLFIVDGTNVWFYIPDDHTASRTKLKQSSDWRTPIALLAGKPDLGRICKNVALAGTAKPEKSAAGGKAPGHGGAGAEGDTLRCTPRETSDQMGEPITDVLLTIDPQGYLVRVLIRQPGDVATEFRFGKWQENIHIAEVMFHFQPPQGVEVVDEDKLAGQMQ